MHLKPESKESVFELNHRVIVLAGDRIGETAWVVEVEATTQEAKYRIEYGKDGKFAQKSHRELRSDVEKRA